jgi:DNA-binding XRE family transcriptional regulator
MANKVSTDKKEFAEALFMQGMPQNTIAEKVGVSANTVGKWAKDGCWGEKRAAMTLTRKEVVNNVLRSLNKLAEKLGDSDLKDVGSLADQIAKLSSTISKLDKEASVVDFIECFMAFGRWLEYQAESDHAITPEFRQMVNKYQNKYILELFGSKVA